MKKPAMNKLVQISCAAALTLTLAATGSLAEQGEVDPGQVSEGLKAIFSLSRSGHSTRDRLNANTTTIISGTIGGTYVQIGADLASVLDDGTKLRVLPIVGRGSVQSVADILFLRVGANDAEVDALQEQDVGDTLHRAAPTRSTISSGRVLPRTSRSSSPM